MRSHRVAILVACVDRCLNVVGREGVYALLVGHRPHFHKFAVQVQHVAASSAFVQVVDVLRDDSHVEVLFKLFQAEVGGIRLLVEQLPAQVVVERVDKRRIAHETVVARHVHHRVVVPQAVGVAECRQSALGADSSAGEND